MRILKDTNFREHIAKQQEASIKYASEFLDGAMERIEKGVTGFGDPMPWDKTKDKIRFRPSEISIWGGYNRSGKSLVLGQCSIWWALHSPVVIASMEMPGEATVERMLRQGSGVEQPSRRFAEGFMSRTDMNLYIYDQLDTMDPDSIIGMVHYSATQLGAKHIVIDSLVKCVKGVDNYNGQKDFVDALCWAAKRYQIHVHLVHHARKPAGDTKTPDRFDIKGAGEIVDLADNVIIVDRNQIKDRLRDSQDPKYDETAPDGFLVVAKQRHGEWDGKLGFWWHEKSQQWTSRQGQALPWPNPEENYQIPG